MCHVMSVIIILCVWLFNFSFDIYKSLLTSRFMNEFWKQQTSVCNWRFLNLAAETKWNHQFNKSSKHYDAPQSSMIQFIKITYILTYCALISSNTHSILSWLFVDSSTALPVVVIKTISWGISLIEISPTKACKIHKSTNCHKINKTYIKPIYISSIMRGNNKI